MELFLARSFESTTVEEIAQSAGISRRSYFRYFSSKDEALAEGLVSIGATLAEALRDRPETESAWLALRRAFDLITQQTDNDPRSRALGRLMLERPGLHYDKNVAWSDTIAAALLARSAEGGKLEPLGAEALAASAIACLHVAQKQWLEPEEHTPLSSLLDSAMKAVHAFN